MRASQVLAALVVSSLVPAGLGSLVVFVTNPLQPTTVAVLVFVVLLVVGASALGGRSRRWRTPTGNRHRLSRTRNRVLHTYLSRSRSVRR